MPTSSGRHASLPERTIIVTREEFQLLRNWFNGYCASFSSPKEEDRRNFALKEAHTYRVCDNMTRLASCLALDEGRLTLAEAIALFHDVGRFPQYKEYKTFNDSVSINHATLGAKVLLEHQALKRLAKSEQDLIIRCVTLHNAFAVPRGLDEDTLLFTRLIRDADKLDIWKVFLDYYAMPADQQPSAVSLGLPDTPGYSPEVLACLRRGLMVQLSTLTTLNDFKLLQLSWIYDLNFSASFAIVDERAYINRMAAALPGTDDVTAAVDAVREFVRGMLRNVKACGPNS